MTDYPYSLYRYTLEIEVPEDLRPTRVLGAMADAALKLDCYVAEEAGMERVFPPLKALPGGTDGD